MPAMRFLNQAIGSLVLAAAGAILAVSCAGQPPPTTQRSTDLPPNREPLPKGVLAKMWKVKGDQIVTATGEPVVLRGIAFGNEVWQDVPLPSSHHSGEDFARVAKMGMNSVRFYLSYRTFEEDTSPYEYKDQGFEWIDQNIDWARQHGIRLVLNMHSPPGGYQSQGNGKALWEDEEMQQRFVSLWRTIAERYRAEPVIAGYDLLNEPAPTRAAHQWKSLAEETISEIREVDQHHMIFIERVNAVAGDWSEDASRNFFRVSDPNVVYEFHFYKPFHFTHQNASFNDFVARESTYPDETAPEVDWFHLTALARQDSEKLPPGDSDWTLLETEPFVVADERVAIGKPYLVCDDSGGRAVFDSLSLSQKSAPDPATAVASPSTPAAPGKKGSPAGAAVATPEAPPAPTWETVYEVDLNTRRGWYFHHPSGKGAVQFVERGQGDQTALAIYGTEGQANLGSDPLRFFTQKGATYQLSGVARGIGLGEKSNCRLRLEFSASAVPVQARGKEYLAQELDAYVAWADKEGVPLYLGEFGTIRDSFLPGRGGLDWVRDMLDLISERKLSFAYHDYHETAFGLFVGGSGLPSVYSANLPLYELFVKSLVGPDADARLLPPTARAQEQEPEDNPAPASEEAVPPEEHPSGETAAEDVHEFD